MFRKILNISTYIILFLSFIMLVDGYFLGRAATYAFVQE